MSIFDSSRALRHLHSFPTRRSSDLEAVRQHFEHAVTGNRHVVLSQLLENGEQHVLLAQRGRVLDLQLFGKSEELEIENRSEEHTSELQSQSNLVCRLLLEKKNDHTN